MNKSAGFFLMATLALVSCGDLLEVRTIRPKAQGSSKFSEGENGGLGMGGYANAKIKKESEDIAVGMTPEVAGYLP